MAQEAVEGGPKNKSWGAAVQMLHCRCSSIRIDGQGQLRLAPCRIRGEMDQFMAIEFLRDP